MGGGCAPDGVIGVRHGEFAIGMTFWTATGVWRCTDIGTRTIAAIQLNGIAATDPTWLDGPPYALSEDVFDEHDFPGCYRTEAELADARSREAPAGMAPEAVQRRGR